MKIGKCPLCGGETREKKVEVQEEVDGEVYILKGINAEVCVQCGERVYSESEMRRMEKIREKIREKAIEPLEIREVKVFPA